MKEGGRANGSAAIRSSGARDEFGGHSTWGFEQDRGYAMQYLTAVTALAISS
jgi:hypothetical protein